MLNASRRAAVPNLSCAATAIHAGGMTSGLKERERYIAQSPGICEHRHANWLGSRELRAIRDGGPLKHFERPADFSFGIEIEGNYFNKIDEADHAAEAEESARIEGAALA
jgi:hypothetical protein